MYEFKKALLSTCLCVSHREQSLARYIKYIEMTKQQSTLCPQAEEKPGGSMSHTRTLPPSGAKRNGLGMVLSPRSRVSYRTTTDQKNHTNYKTSSKEEVENKTGNQMTMKVSVCEMFTVTKKRATPK